MLQLAQQSLRNVRRHVAMSGAFPDFGGKALRNGGGQFLGAQRLTHAIILPLVGSKILAQLAGASSTAQVRARMAAVKRFGPPVASSARIGSLCSAPSSTWAIMPASASGRCAEMSALM